MNLIGKRFQNKSGKICVIKDINENITTFDDNTRVETKYLLDKKFFVELPSQPSQASQNFTSTPDKFDPNYLMNTQRNPILEQIRSLPSDVIERLPADNLASRNNFYPTDNSFAVIPEDPEMEKQELARKYGVNTNTTTVTNNAIDQANAQMNKLLNDPKWGKMLSEELNYQPQPQMQQQAQAVQTEPVVQSRPIQQDNFDYQPQTRQVDPVIENKYHPQNNFVDPIISMFQKTKRNTEFKVTVDLVKKIPRLDTIEMLEDSYEVSIIDYLAEEFTEQLLSNPSIIRNKIAQELRDMLERRNPKPKVEVKQEVKQEVKEPVKSTAKTTTKPAAKKAAAKTTKAKIVEQKNNTDL